MKERVDVRWQTVTCAACHRTFQCTPSSDYYNNTTLEDGVCEPCLLSGHKGANPPTEADGERSLQEVAQTGGAAVVLGGPDDGASYDFPPEDPS